MRKIATVIPKYGLIGGAEQFSFELTKRLGASKDYEFHVLANRWQPDVHTVRIHRIPVISFPRFLTTISFAYFVQRELRRNDFSLVHSHERIFAADIFTLHGVPHRYWVHRVRQKKMSLFDAATAWVEKRLVYHGRCRKFVAVSQLSREIFLREYPINPDLVTVIHPGVSLPDYAPKDRDALRRSVRSELGIDADCPVILFVSMNFELKGLDDIFLSLAQLRAQKFKLIVAGKGNLKKYAKLAENAQIADRVIFTGPVGKDRLIRLYSAGDLYMMLSRFDTLGMVVLEAMAAGLPVVISSHVGARDLVREDKNGFIIDNTSDYPYIASKLKVLFDQNIRGKMSANAYQTACENTWEAVAAKYRKIYADILAGKI